MRVEQGLAPVEELRALRGEFVGLGLRRCLEVGQLDGDHLPQRGDDVLGDSDAAPVVGDEAFDLGDGHRATLAADAAGVPAGADEVGVDVALLALGVVDQQPGAALAAVDGAFEVVLVGLRALASGLVGGEHVLHAVPDLGLNQPVVRTVVARTFEGDVALVVRVLQDAVHRRSA